ncbi:MAG: ankyrin repeat domain-containing protein [Gammaproteobacteria bacterium]|nr:ankyrin repeat domain-containing protein [Gammaproteobacteria bacterium]MDH5801575.1 ankyrin repeat domain-containing protein [Gammaproteobacteria bacterium]
MNLTKYCYLLVNTNNLSDFLFQQELLSFAANLPVEQEPVDAAEQEAILEASLADLDFSHLSEIDYGQPSLPYPGSANMENPVMDTEVTGDTHTNSPVSVNGESYEKTLLESYATMESMQAVFSALYAKSDLDYLNSLQAALPRHLTSLEQALTAQDIEAWLPMLKDNDAFIALANCVRQLMPNEDDFNQAILLGDLETVKNNLDLFAIGEPQLEATARAKNVEMFQLLLSKCKPTPYGIKSIMQEVIDDPIYFDIFVNILKPDEPLLADLLVPALYNGCEEVVRFLVAKTDLNNSHLFPDNLPLVYAIRGQNLELAQLMLDNGADPLAQSKEGTPMEIAQSWLPQGHELIDLLKTAQ